MMNIDTQVSQSSSRVDRMGTFASSACALHCAVCALAPATFTALGLSFLVTHEVEWLLTGFAVVLGLFAVYQGWRRHGNVVVMATLCVGVIGLLAARGLEGGGHDEGHEGASAPAAESVKAEATAASADHGAEASHDGEEHHGDEHHGAGHIMGELVGVLAGLILCFGHIINLREWKRAGPSGSEKTACGDC